MIWTMVDPLREFSPKVVANISGDTSTADEAQVFLECCLRAMGENPARYILAKEIIKEIKNDKY